MFNLGPLELVIILFIILLLFGARKLPELAKSMGSAVREFGKAAKGEGEEPEGEEERAAILEAARRMGIDTEGKSLSEIAKEIAKAAEKKG